MNKTRYYTWALLIVAGITALSQLAHGQTPSITSFGRNGMLIAEQLEPGTTAVVEWAPTVDGPWSGNWDGLNNILVEEGGTIQVNVPMFYRVRGIPTNPDPENLTWIPAGTFTMGSPPDEPERNALVATTGLGSERQHEVTISRGFWIGKYEVTQEFYGIVTGANPSRFPNDLDLPVENVSWLDAMACCNKLTQRERDEGRLPDGYVYRLPTEAEWEYACRAGATTVFHYGNELRSGMANFRGTSEYSLSEGGTVDNPDGIALEMTTTVGSYQPNAWGLYDMHGNVWEWCYDWIDDYAIGPVTDPVITDNRFEVGARVARGGSWRGGAARSARSAHRNFWVPEYNNGNGNVGFRVVLAPSIE